MEFVLLDHLISEYSFPVVCKYGKIFKWKAIWQIFDRETNSLVRELKPFMSVFSHTSAEIAGIARLSQAFSMS